MERYSIFDFSALVNHCLHSGQDDNPVELENGRTCNRAEHGFGVFLDEYLLPVLIDTLPRYLLTAHDSGSYYREFIAPDYKAKRRAKKAANSNSVKSLEFDKLSRWMKQILASIGSTQLMVDGVEADDIIGYLCQGIPYPKRVYTVDADLMVLADKNTQLYLKNCYIDPSDPDSGYATKFVLMMFEVCGKDFPRYVSLAKALLGDSSDEFIGVNGFGSGCWKDMVKEVGISGLDEILQAIKNKDFGIFYQTTLAYEQENLPIPKWLSLIHTSLSEFRKGWALASLHPELCHKPFQKKIPKIDWFKRVPSQKLLMKVLRESGYAHLSDHFDKYMPRTFVVDNNSFNSDMLDRFAEQAKKSPVIAFDYETWDDNYENFKKAARGIHVDVAHSRISGISMSYGENWEHNFYLTVDHKDSDNLPAEKILEFFDRIPEDTKLVAHSAFFEITVTLCQIKRMLIGVYDTQLMSKYVDENEFSSLKFLSKRDLNYKQQTYVETIAQAGFEGATMRDLTVEQVVGYGVDDSIVTGLLFDLMKLRMMLENTWDFYEQNELLVNNVLVHAYVQGVRCDWDAQATIETADLETVEVNTKRLRELLLEHCSEPSIDNVEHFFNAESAVYRLEASKKFDMMPEAMRKAAFEKAGIEPSKVSLSQFIEIATNEKIAALIRESAYEEYREVEMPVEFIPTANKMNKFTESLGFKLPMSNISNAGIREWLRSNSSFDLDGGGDEQTPLQKRFIKLLAAANPEIKDRCGDHYNRLAAFVSKNDSTPPKIVKRGTELSLNSPKQGQYLLYCMLGAKVRNRVRPQRGSFRDQQRLDGAPATDEIAVLTAIAEDFESGSWQEEALRCLLAAKSAKTRLGLYHTPYKLWRHPDDDLLYPQIRNFGTVTGRPSGNSPNILQVSKHQQDGIMRSLYLPRHDDHCIISIDFAGQELRILASITGDRNLLSAYIGASNADKYLRALPNGVLLQWTNAEVAGLSDLKDVHTQTAAGISGIFEMPQLNYDAFFAVLHDEEHEHYKTAAGIRKRPAKSTNFLMSYGGTPPALAQRLIIPLRKAEKIMDATSRVYPGIAKWQASSAAFARLHGYTITAYGKRRHVTEEIFSKQGGVRSRVERQAANAEIQGTAADILKIVLSNSWREDIWLGLGAIMIAPVYDEIVASVPISQAIPYIRKMTAIMNITPKGQPVPMVADISIGKNWQKQAEIGTNPTDEEITKAANACLKVAENG